MSKTRNGEPNLSQYIKLILLSWARHISRNAKVSKLPNWNRMNKLTYGRYSSSRTKFNGLVTRWYFSLHKSLLSILENIVYQTHSFNLEDVKIQSHETRSSITPAIIRAL